MTESRWLTHGASLGKVRLPLAVQVAVVLRRCRAAPRPRLQKSRDEAAEFGRTSANVVRSQALPTAVPGAHDRGSRHPAHVISLMQLQLWYPYTLCAPDGT